MFKSVKFVPTRKIHLHEAHEPRRLKALQSKIISDGYLNDPLLVTEMPDGHFFVIDGVHRFNSLYRMGCDYIPVQVVDPNQIHLSTWAHEVPVGEWLSTLQLDFPSEWSSQPGDDRNWLACMMDETGRKQWLLAPQSGQQKIKERLASWHKIVNAYLNKVAIVRLPSDHAELPALGHVRLIYPIWQMADITAAVAVNSVLPPGTTRFMIPNRLQGLHIPLYLLTDLAYSQTRIEQAQDMLNISLYGHYPQTNPATQLAQMRG